MSVLASPAARRRSGRFANVGPLGIVLALIWAALGVGLIVLLASAIKPEAIELYGARFLRGFLTTLELVVLSLGFGAVLSIPVTMGRLSRNRAAAAIAYGYSYFFRGTPLLAQLFLIYYGVGQFSAELRAIGLWWLFRDAFVCAVIAFTLNTAAYQAEILAGAIRSVPRGQSEAADALGFHRWPTLSQIILPQALINALRPYGNEAILMIKASSVASIVTVLDLMGQTRFIFSKTYDLSFYLWAAVFYLATVDILSRVVNMIEARLTRHLKKA